MSIVEEVELLRRIPLFAKIDPTRLKLLAFTSDRVKFDPGQVVFEQGEGGDYAYVIIEGEADISVNTPSGPLSVATLKEHELVGEIAILCDVPRTATVTATGELVALQISKDLFYRLVTEFPEMAIEIMRDLARRLELTTGRLQQAVVQGQKPDDA
ncbi:MAG: Crp/Fnr family transcriptional regulator [Alphaproteobacteria bacterium]|jgi:CRP/FNR family transcriptional regulator, cyclic AMP receptor protein|nr:Crp/Fnr family transcriptional regulator [Alphaproteobacteria bacterium]